MSHFFRPDYSEMVGECWLQSARVARKAGHHQTAYNALLNAGDSRLAELYVERAKWLWSKVMAKEHHHIYIFCCRLGTSYKVLTEMIPNLNSEPSFSVTFLHHLSTIIWKKLPSVLKSQIFSHSKTENAVLSVFVLSFIFFSKEMTNFYFDFTFYMFT